MTRAVASGIVFWCQRGSEHNRKQTARRAEEQRRAAAEARRREEAARREREIMQAAARMGGWWYSHGDIGDGRYIRNLYKIEMNGNNFVLSYRGQCMTCQRPRVRWNRKVFFGRVNGEVITGKGIQVADSNEQISAGGRLNCYYPDAEVPATGKLTERGTKFDVEVKARTSTRGCVGYTSLFNLRKY